MEYGDQIKLSSGVIWTLVSIHDNGSLQVRINKWQNGAWQMISASEEDIEIIEQEKEEGHKVDVYNHMLSIKQIAVWILVVLVILLAIWVGNFGGKEELKLVPQVKNEDPIYMLIKELNQYNTEDIQDIWACKRIKERDKKKRLILEQIEKLK